MNLTLLIIGAIGLYYSLFTNEQLEVIIEVSDWFGVPDFICSLGAFVLGVIGLIIRFGTKSRN